MCVCVHCQGEDRALDRIPEYIEKYSHLATNEQLKDTQVMLAGRHLSTSTHTHTHTHTLMWLKLRNAGRVASIRQSGQKLRFYDLRGEDAKVQVGMPVDAMRAW